MNRPTESDAYLKFVRNLVAAGGVATLGTLKQGDDTEPPAPFVSLVTYAVTGANCVAMLLSGLAKQPKVYPLNRLDTFG